jgi:hypothetical protein
MQLMELVDYLSMHDLKSKIRRIVDRKRLHEIYACLDNGRLEFLRQCLQSKESDVSSSLILEGWQGNREELQKMFHRCGLIRLGTALIEQSPTLVWHLTHTFDTGRSDVIMRCYEKQVPLKIVELLARQVCNIINYLEMKRS